jgi:hypothetical protein
MLIIILRVGRSSIRMERLEVESKRPWAIIVEHVPSEEENQILYRYAIRASVQTNLMANGFKNSGY